MSDKTEEQQDVEEVIEEGMEDEIREVVEEAADDTQTVETLDNDVKQVEGKLLRLRADFDNFRKRTQREKEQWSALALENLMFDLLMVLDHFELGLKNADEHEAKPAVAEGFRLVYEQMAQCLKKHKLDEIEAEDKAFDPDVHEAISTLPSDDVENGNVAVLTRRGYKLGSKVIRPAQVVVSSGPAQPAPSEESEA